MRSVTRKTSRISAAVLALLGLGAMLESEALGREQRAQPAPAVDYQLMGAEWAGELPGESLKFALLEWIGANSDYDVSGALANPPAVRFCEHGTTLVYEGKAIHFDDRLNGVYDQQTKQIEFVSKKVGKFIGKIENDTLVGEFVEMKQKVRLKKGQSFWQRQ